MKCVRGARPNTLKPCTFNRRGGFGYYRATGAGLWPCFTGTGWAENPLSKACQFLGGVQQPRVDAGRSGSDGRYRQSIPDLSTCGVLTIAVVFPCLTAVDTRTSAARYCQFQRSSFTAAPIFTWQVCTKPKSQTNEQITAQ